MLGGIEAGGTKFVCAVGPSPSVILQRAVFPTRTPDETFGDVIAFFRAASERHGPLKSLGIGSFGPLVLDPASPSFGHVAATPKPGWSGADLHGRLMAALGCPVAVDTDVNASGLGEALLGAGQGLGSIAYVTVGTGIGGGLILQGRPRHGMTHPEMGHIRVRRHTEDHFAGACPFHGDCLEGLASGRAIFARLGCNLADVPADHPVREILADYLGQLCGSLVLMASPERIVLGGGVMASNPVLFSPVRAAAEASLAGYIKSWRLNDALASFIVPPDLGPEAGIIGALIMAEQQAHTNRRDR